MIVTLYANAYTRVCAHAIKNICTCLYAGLATVRPKDTLIDELAIYMFTHMSIDMPLHLSIPMPIHTSIHRSDNSTA